MLQHVKKSGCTEKTSIFFKSLVILGAADKMIATSYLQLKKELCIS